MGRIAIRHSKYYKVGYYFTVSIICIVSNGCHLSYPTSGNLDIEPWPIGSGQSTSSLSVVVGQETFVNDTKEKKEDLDLLGDLQEITVRAFKKSGRFSTIKIGKFDSDFSVSANFKIYLMESSFSTLVAILTFGVIPTYTTYKVFLDFEIHGTGKEILGNISQSLSVKRWRGWIFVVVPYKTMDDDLLFDLVRSTISKAKFNGAF